MAETRRAGLSVSQKRKLWERWKRGQSLNDRGPTRAPAGTSHRDAALCQVKGLHKPERSPAAGQVFSSLCPAKSSATLADAMNVLPGAVIPRRSPQGG